VVERRPLRVAQVVQDGPRRADRRSASGQAAAVEGQESEVLPQRAIGVVETEYPLFQTRGQHARGGLLGAQQRQFVGHQHLARADLL